MEKMVSEIVRILDKENIDYYITETVDDIFYINIENSSTMARIKVFEYACGSYVFLGVKIQEFNELGTQTYEREFANIHSKPFINRIKKNIG